MKLITAVLLILIELSSNQFAYARNLRSRDAFSEDFVDAALGYDESAFYESNSFDEEQESSDTYDFALELENADIPDGNEIEEEEQEGEQDVDYWLEHLVAEGYLQDEDEEEFDFLDDSLLSSEEDRQTNEFPMKFMVNVPAQSWSPGTHEFTYGPIKTELNDHHTSEQMVIKKFTPNKTMGVHHMLLSTVHAPRKQNWSPSYNSAEGPIIFAWAMTGMNFKPFELPQDVGLPVSDETYFAINAHVEMKAQDAANHMKPLPGFELEVDRAGPSTKLAGITSIAPWDLRLAPGQKNLDVRVTCQANRDMNVFAVRNHAHFHMTQIYSYMYHQGKQTKIDSIKGGQAQVFNRRESELTIPKGSILSVHCEYDTSKETSIVENGADLSLHEEMCNQYLMYYPFNNNALSCGNNPSLDPQQFKTFTADRLGQIAGTAHTYDGRHAYIFARRSNNFLTSKPIQADTIFKYDTKNNMLLSQFGGGGLFVTPHGMYVDGWGHLWLTDTSTHEVIKMDGKTGAVLMKLGERFHPGEGDYQFNAPTDVAVSTRTGDIYISDGYGNSRVVQYDRHGSFIRSWGGRRGSKIGLFDIPHNIELDEHDNVYVADRQNCRVQVFNHSGEYLRNWQSEFCDLSRPDHFKGNYSSLSYNRKHKMMFSIEGSHLIARSKSGTVLDVLAGDRIGRGIREFDWPHDVSVPYDGEISSIIVAELNNERAQFLMPIEGPK